MASSSSSKLENNDGNEAPQWTSQCITCDEIDGVPLNVLTNRRVLDHAFSEQQSGAEVDPASVDPHAAASVDPVMLTQPPPSPSPVVETVPTEIGYSEAMTSVRPLGTQHYYIPDPLAHLIPPPPPPPLHSSPSLPPRPPSQPITYSRSIQQSTMMSITPPSFSQPQSQTTSTSLPNQTLTSPLDQTIPQSPPPPPPSQSQTTTTSLPPPSPTPLPSPQTLTSSSHQTMPSPSPSPPPPPSSDQNHAIASPPQQSDQTTTSTPLPPPPSSQSAKPKVISPLSLSPSEPLLVTTTKISPPPLASHPTTTPTTGAQASASVAAESTREMLAKRKRGRPRKEFAEERSESGVEGRVEEASQEKKKHIQGEGEGEDKGRQPAPSFASPSSTSASPSVLFNHPNSTVLGFSSCRNVIQPASIIASQNEDISAKIISFALNNGAVFVLAASGQLSSLRYMEPSGVVQETTGVYEILSLSGTLLLSNEGEALARRSRTGYLTISVVGMDGKIIGGRVCGSMIAASPVQVVGGAIVAAASDDKDSASSKHPSSDQSVALLLELNKQISSLSQEWQAQLLDTKTKAKEMRQLLNQTRQELQETRLSVNTTQNLLMQLFEQLNIVNPPPPPHSSTSNPPSL